jgi:hypothetical protein
MKRLWPDFRYLDILVEGLMKASNTVIPLDHRFNPETFERQAGLLGRDIFSRFIIIFSLYCCYT